MRLILVILLCFSVNRCNGRPKDIALATYLSAEYDKNSVPVLHINKSITVYLGIALRKILGVEEFEQLVTLNIWVRMYWKDEYIHWKKEDFNNQSEIRVDHDLVWRPDIALYTDGAGDYSPSMDNVQVIISNDGYVTYLYPSMYKVACRMDIIYFPFDEQHCQIELGSWAYDSSVLDLKLRESSPADYTDYQTNTAWQLINFTASQHNKSYGCCPDLHYPSNVYELTIRRHWQIHFYYMLIPIILIQCLAVLQFLLPCDSGEKVSLGITIYLSMLVYLLMVSEMLPSTEAIPMLVRYIVATLVMVAIAQMITIVVLMIHHNGRHDNHSMLPHWARFVFLHVMASCLGMGRYITSDSEHELRLHVGQTQSVLDLRATKSEAVNIKRQIRKTPVHDYLPSHIPDTCYEDREESNEGSSRRNTRDSLTVPNINLNSNITRDWQNGDDFDNDNDNSSVHRESSEAAYRDLLTSKETPAQGLCSIVPPGKVCGVSRVCRLCNTHCSLAFMSCSNANNLCKCQLSRKLGKQEYDYVICCCRCMKNKIQGEEWPTLLVPIRCRYDSVEALDFGTIETDAHGDEGYTDTDEIPVNDISESKHSKNMEQDGVNQNMEACNVKTNTDLHKSRDNRNNNNVGSSDENVSEEDCKKSGNENHKNNDKQLTVKPECIAGESNSVVTEDSLDTNINTSNNNNINTSSNDSHSSMNNNNSNSVEPSTTSPTPSLASLTSSVLNLSATTSPAPNLPATTSPAPNLHLSTSPAPNKSALNDPSFSKLTSNEDVSNQSGSSGFLGRGSQNKASASGISTKGSKRRYSFQQRNSCDGSRTSAKTSNTPSNTPRTARQRRMTEARMATQRQSETTIMKDTIEGNMDKLLYLIYKRILEFKQRLGDEDVDAEVRCEWQQVAMVLDRLMFFIFTTGTLVMLVIMYMTIPFYTHLNVEDTLGPGHDH